MADQGGGGHPKERAASGRAARADAPRSAHADYRPSAKRPDPVDVVEKQSAARLPELVPIRYGRMLESPFRFYRALAVFAERCADQNERDHQALTDAVHTGRVRALNA